MRNIKLPDDVQEVSQAEECGVQEDEIFFEACEKASREDSVQAKALTKEDISKFFQMIERSPLRCEKMLMSAEDAAELGVVNRCDDCGKPLVEPHVHTMDECNAHAVRTVTES